MACHTEHDQQQAAIKHQLCVRMLLQSSSAALGPQARPYIATGRALQDHMQLPENPAHVQRSRSSRSPLDTAGQQQQQQQQTSQTPAYASGCSFVHTVGLHRCQLIQQPVGVPSKTMGSCCARLLPMQLPALLKSYLCMLCSADVLHGTDLQCCVLTLVAAPTCAKFVQLPHCWPLPDRIFTASSGSWYNGLKQKFVFPSFQDSSGQTSLVKYDMSARLTARYIESAVVLHSARLGSQKP
jgi:hypothetical protein